MSLLLSAIVTAEVRALGRTSKEAGKAVQVAMAAMTQTVVPLKWSKLEASKPIQSHTSLPATTSKKPSKTLPNQTTTVQTKPSLQACY